MRNLIALGVLAGGFLFTPTPKAIVTTVLRAAARSHPAVGALVLLTLVATWRGEDDYPDPCRRRGNDPRLRRRV